MASFKDWQRRSNGITATETKDLTPYTRWQKAVKSKKPYQAYSSVTEDEDRPTLEWIGRRNTDPLYAAAMEADARAIINSRRQQTSQPAMLRSLEDVAREAVEKEDARKNAIRANPSMNVYYNGLGAEQDNDPISSYGTSIQVDWAKPQSRTSLRNKIASISGTPSIRPTEKNETSGLKKSFQQASVEKYLPQEMQRRAEEQAAEEAAEKLRRDNYDVQAGQAAIDDAKKALASYQRAYDDAYELNLQNPNDETYRQMIAASDALEEKKQELSDMETRHRQDSYYVNVTKPATDRMNAWDQFRNSPEFASYAQQGAEIENPTWNQSKGTPNIFGWQPFAKEIQNPVTFWRSDEVKGRADNWADSEGSLYNYMTDSEVELYNALLARDREQGTDEAETYLSDISELLAARKGGKIASDVNSEDSKMNQLFYGAVSGMERYKSGNRQALSLLTSDKALTRPSSTYGSPLVQQDITEDGSLWKLAYDATENISNNALPAVAGTAAGALFGPTVGGLIGQATFGPTVYGNTYRDEVRPMIGSGETGRDPKQAKVKAALSTASELGLGELIGGIPGVGGVLSGKAISALSSGINSAIARTGVRMLGNAMGEFTEESLQDIIEPVLDNIAYGEKNRIEITPESIYSGVVGAVTSMLMGGGAQVRNSLNMRGMGQNVIEIGKTEALVQNALNLPNTEAAKIAERMQTGKMQETPANVGELLRAYSENGGNMEFLAVPAQETAQETAEEAPAAPAQTDTVQADDAEALLRKAAWEAVTGEEDAELLAEAASADYSPADSGVNEQFAEEATQKARAEETTQPVAERQPGEAAPKNAQEATNNETGETVAVSGVESVEDGKVYLRTADGGRIAADEVGFENSNWDDVYSHAAAFETNAARTYIGSYDGETSPADYYNGFVSIYGAARKGETLEQAVSGSLYAQELSPAQQQAAYFAGQNSLNTTQESAQAGVQAAAQVEGKTVPVKAQTAQEAAQDAKTGVVRSYTAKLSTEQENSLKVLDAMGRTLNRKINIVDSIGTEGGKANAYFDPKTNEYTIALDSVGEAYLLVAAHENVHDIAANNREGYAKMESIVMDTLDSLGLDEETLMDVQRALAPNENEAYWREEIVANTVPSILSDEATLKEFVQKMAGADADTRSAFVKFLDTMRDFLRNAFDKLKVELSWQQMQIISENQQAIERIRSAYFEALDGLMENEKTSSDITGEEKYSPRLPENFISDEQIEKNIHKVANMDSVAEVTGNEFPRDEGGSLIDRVFNSYEERGVKEIIRDDIGIIQINRKGIRSSAAHGIGRRKVAAFAAVPEVLQNGKIVDVKYDYKGKQEDRVVIAAPITLGGKTAFVGAVIQKTVNSDSFYLHEVEIKDAPTFRTTAGIDSWLGSDGASSLDIILDRLANDKTLQEENSEIKFSMQDSDGNTLTEEQQEYFKNSKVRDEDGRLMVMHHGTPYGGFTVFKSASYFTQDKNYANKYQNPSASSLRGRYSEATNPMTYDVYLNMEKPFDTRNAAEREIFENEYYRKYGTGTPLMESGLPDWTDGMDLQEFIEENEYDYDGLILDEGGVPSDDGGVQARGLSYVVFDPSQVKDVSNKQPTRNPDIRFSRQDGGRVLDSGDVKRLTRTIEQRDETIAALKQQLRLTHGVEIQEKEYGKLAGEILKATSSKYDKAQLTNELRTLLRYSTTQENPSAEEIETYGMNLASAVLEKAEAVNDTLYKETKDLRDYLRNTPIRLTSAQLQEAASAYDSVSAFRRMLRGRVKMDQKNGTSLDTVWQELSERFPALFDAETNEGDMATALADTVDMIYDRTPVNPYGFDTQHAAYDLLMDIYAKYMELPAFQSFADKQAAKLKEARAQYSQKIAEMRKASKARYDERLKELRADNVARRQELSAKYKDALANQRTEMLERIKKQYRTLTDKKAEALMKQRAAFNQRIENSRAKQKESAAVKKYRGRIESTSKELMSWLTHPTDAKHVPDGMRKAVSGFLETIDFAGNKTTKKAEAWREQMYKLRDAMEKASRGAGDFSEFYVDIDPDFAPALQDYMERNSGVQTISEMNSTQLKELSEVLGMVKHAVKTSNQLHSNARYQQVSSLAEASRDEMSERRSKMPKGKLAESADQLLNFLQLDSFSYFKELGSASESVLAELRKGFDKKVERLSEAEAFMQKATEKMNLPELSGKKAQLHTFKTQEGKALQLTTAQIMELYLLNKREQARGHIYGMGIRVNETTAKEGKKTVRTRMHSAAKMTEADVNSIIGTLTTEQKRLADAMGKFLGDNVSAWGNETSMSMYGYKKFTEENYYPIRTDDNYTATREKDESNGSLYALKNLGMTKATQEGAKNPLILGDIFDTFTRHIDEMSSYNGLVEPLSDAMKWFNWKSEDGSVKQEIFRIMGERGKKWFKNFIGDINGQGMGANYSSDLMARLTGSAKAAAVGANARVVIQQPTSYVRAAAVMNPKYLLKALTMKSNQEMAQKYSQIAKWKSWGFYDLHTGRSMRDIIVGDTTLADNIRKKSMALAGKADDWTLGTLWNASALEMRELHPELTPGSEAFNNAVGARLSEIIDSTQVVDSVFHRSEIMRSKNGYSQMLTAFMAEPTKNYNLLRNAMMQAIRGKTKADYLHAARVATAFVVSSIGTAAAASIVDAFRDSDDEKNWLEKYMDSLGGNIVDNVNPLGMIPIVSDILEIMQGFSASRMDMQGIEKIWNVGQQWVKFLSGTTKWSTERLIYQSAVALSSVTGLPVSNLMRDLTGLYNTFTPGGKLNISGTQPTQTQSYASLYEAIQNGKDSKSKKLYDSLYAKALKDIKESDEKCVAAGKNPAYADESSYQTAARNAVESDLATILAKSDARVAQAYEYREAGNTGAYEKLYREMQAQGFSFNTIAKAINKYKNMVDKGETDTLDYKQESRYSADNLVTAAENALRTGNTDDVRKIFEERISASEAQDPVSSVRAPVTKELMPRYVEAVRTGNTEEAEKIASLLTDVFGYDEKTLGTNVTKDRNEDLRSAVETRDATAAKEFIAEARKAGKKDTDIASAINDFAKEQITTAALNNDYKTYDAWLKFLRGLGLRDSKGNYYASDRISDWVRAAKEEARKKK